MTTKLIATVLVLLLTNTLAIPNKPNSDTARVKNSNPPVVTPIGAISRVLFGVHSKIVSPIDDHRCKMYPSCSGFAAISFKRYGAIGGALRTFDRLHRCGHDLQFYKTIAINDTIKYYDKP